MITAKKNVFSHDDKFFHECTELMYVNVLLDAQTWRRFRVEWFEEKGGS